MMVGRKVDYDINDLYIHKDGKGDIDYQKSFNAFLTIIVRDNDGKIIRKYKQKSHSPTANFIGLMLPLTWYLTTGNSWSIVNTSNTTYSYAPSIPIPGFGIGYPCNGTNHNDYIVNILVGSGSSSNPYNAYNLNAPISNGSGTGQLLYSSISIPTGITINGNQAYFIISQSLANQSGTTITISEVGIITYLNFTNMDSNTTTPGSSLVWYDVLSSPISIANGQSVVIYYTFSVNA